MSLLALTPRARGLRRFRLELFSGQSDVLLRINQIVSKTATKGDPDGDLKLLLNYLAGGEAIIVIARTEKALAGFLVLDASKGVAPFSWVGERYRNCGLGERFYSFACINLAQNAPEFRFHKNMLEEYGYVLKAIGARSVSRDPFYIVHERSTQISQESKQDEVGSAVTQTGDSRQRAVPRRLVIGDAEWVGYSPRDARRLKLSTRRVPRLVYPSAR